jgi:flagellar motor switch/type III secretory pathway protein FliN
MPETAAVMKPEPVEQSDAPVWQHVYSLRCHLTAELPVPEFTVGALSELARDSVVDSHWSVTEDIPLRINGELVALGEFEVVGNALAVRVTELA